MSDEIERAYMIINKRLSDFDVSSPRDSKFIWQRPHKCVSLDRDQFPVPSLVLFVLNGICGFPIEKKWDKTHWEIPFCYKSVECVIAHEKIGIRLYFDESEKSTVDSSEIIVNLKCAIGISERTILTKIAQEQISSANITIANLFVRLDNSYFYFKNQAATSFKLLKTKNDGNAAESIFKNLNRILNANSEGSYNAIAMIDAYFSRLEHFLVLALPFASFDRKKDDLNQFVGFNWTKKMKRIFSMSDPKIQKYYRKLVMIKEKYRNTFAHGGFEKKGESFYFHLPNFGVIPAKMTGFQKSVHFNLFPFDENRFDEVCIFFDEFDEWIKEETLPAAWMFAVSGLDLRFDEKYIEEIIKVSSDLEGFEAWIQAECYHSDMIQNADY